MRRWDPVLVEWEDAHANTENWHPTTDIVHKPRRVRTAGLLWKSDDHGITIAQSHDKTSGSVDSSLFIPKANIVNLRELT